MPFNKFCSDPTVAEPADQPLKLQLKWLFFLRVVVLTLLLGTSILLQAQGHELLIPPLGYITTFIAGVYLFTICSALLLNNRRFRCFHLFAYVQIFTDAILVSTLILYTGGSQSLFTILYFFPIICASILLLRQGGLATAAFCTLFYGTILVTEHLGYYPLLFQEVWQSPLTSPVVVMHFFAVTGMSFFLVAVLSALLAERLQKTEAALSAAALNYDRLALLYKQIVDDITSGIITVDPSGAIASFNRAAEEITGFDADEMLNRAIDQQFPEFAAAEKKSNRPVTNLVRRDGTSIPVGFSRARLNLPAEQGHYRLYTFQDLSRIKMLEEQMRQAEKMAVIGEMAAGVAHEFRNPLAAISGSAQVLTQELEIDSANRGLMNIIIRECDRLEKSISDFLLFSKPSVPEKKWLSLPGLVNDTFNLLRRAPNWNDGCRLSMEVPPQLDCWADPGQLQQVLFNLINNSCLAMGKAGGEVTVTAEELDAEEGGGQTVLKVADNGPGIPETLAAKIFEPFFTTREKGTGLGLAIVRQIIDSHGGSIKVEKDRAQGALFIVTLPLP